MHWPGRGAAAAANSSRISARRPLGPLVDPGARLGGQRFAAFGQAYDVVARVEHGVVRPRLGWEDRQPRTSAAELALCGPVQLHHVRCRRGGRYRFG